MKPQMRSTIVVISRVLDRIALYLRAGAPCERPWDEIRHLHPQTDICTCRSFRWTDAELRLDLGIDRQPAAAIGYHGITVGVAAIIRRTIEKLFLGTVLLVFYRKGCHMGNLLWYSSGPASTLQLAVTWVARVRCFIAGSLAHLWRIAGDIHELLGPSLSRQAYLAHLLQAA